MARKEYGYTWWGQQWLTALTKIDYSNRIPRGKSYARRGMVADIEVKNGKIKTKVKGSRSSPYNVSFSMPKISQKDIDTMMELVMNKPTTISKLLNGKMDPKLLDIAAKVGIKLLPNSSSDMTMTCSCPDWAVPCKHLAASIYKLCEDIDNDPFVLFECRGIDLPKILEGYNINVFDIQNQLILSRDEFVKDHIVSSKNKAPEQNRLPLVDFSILDDRRADLVKLLDDKPSFYNIGNFRDVLANQLKRIGKKADRILDGKVELSTHLSPEIIIDGYAPRCTYHHKNQQIIAHNLKFHGLLELTAQELDLRPYEVREYKQITNIALHLIAKGLIVPTS